MWCMLSTETLQVAAMVIFNLCNLMIFIMLVHVVDCYMLYMLQLSLAAYIYIIHASSTTLFYDLQAEKLLKKQAKRGKSEKQMQEIKRVREVLELQGLLDSMGSDATRSDFQTGKHGAIVSSVNKRFFKKMQ